MMLPDGAIMKIGQSDELFHATCGGMGLTGIILNASIKLKKIKSSYINQLSIRTNNLRQTFDIFESHSKSSYTVAWFDGFSRLDNFGKAIVQVGEFSDDNIWSIK